MQSEVTSQLPDSIILHLQCNGWSKIGNESIINKVNSMSEPLFVDVVSIKENRHSARYFIELINIIETYGADNVVIRGNEKYISRFSIQNKLIPLDESLCFHTNGN